MADSQYSEGYVYHFDCTKNEVDSKTLITSLSTFTEIIEQINEDFGIGKKIEIRVKPFQAGSFDIPLDLIQVTIAGILSEHSNSIPEIIKIYIELLKLKLNLKGDEPQKTEEIDAGIKVTNTTGDVTIVDKRTINIFTNNEQVHSSIERQFERLNEDASIKEVQLRSQENEPLVSIKRDDFKTLLPHKELIDINSIKEESDLILEKASLNIFKVVFGENYKWEFFYKDHKISAKILDKEFNSRILAGERFANGDVLQVDLHIVRIFDKISNTFVNKSYEILKVEKHIPREEQHILELE